MFDCKCELSMGFALGSTRQDILTTGDLAAQLGQALFVAERESGRPPKLIACHPSRRACLLSGVEPDGAAHGELRLMGVRFETSLDVPTDRIVIH